MRRLSRRTFASMLPMPVLAQPAQPAGPSWKPCFEFDDLKITLTLADACALSEKTAIVCGFGRHPLEAAPRLLLFLSNNGGKTWAERKAPSLPLSLFALDAQNLWLCGDGSLHFSSDQGEKWKKLDRPGRSTKVHFTDPATGFAYGGDGRIFRTENGGDGWRKLNLDPRELDTSAQWIAVHFTDRANGIVAGAVMVALDETATAPDGSRLSRGMRKRLGKTHLVMLRTTDGGQTWRTADHPCPGDLTALRTDGTRGYAAYDLSGSSTSAGQIATIDMRTLDSTIVFRRDNIRVQDLWLTPDGDVLAAATSEDVNTTGKREASRVLMFRSADNGKTWSDMRVNYRARGRTIALRPGPAGQPWLVVSGGTVLQYG